jgi:Tfp pilus assembly protein FimV
VQVHLRLSGLTGERMAQQGLTQASQERRHKKQPLRTAALPSRKRKNPEAAPSMKQLQGQLRALQALTKKMQDSIWQNQQWIMGNLQANSANLIRPKARIKKARSRKPRRTFSDMLAAAPLANEQAIAQLQAARAALDPREESTVCDGIDDVSWAQWD